ncbi:CRISPR-associated helicase/endonuclease Cas3 [Afifella marina]|uniref:CRISPR-associated endonuclease/helicase Cas3 n=1 Tax=Afifella marina DSM 2698 TaxID=1120955 RepID=A0A1G5P6H1_AFIMA|nr:CRISPR-associated helicase/endonuclease Cas3 [Afifella marina]MBK1624825.1 CRISPR-associated helicase/endonuclease Cas3 [Afifella marina DSM 2698]MBK1628419.1 CRISPR-associated helicase/endonuclease Cas3 [Afifella marina]MBK5917906.1 CRISPR-associated helicase/endonuclease Cas3 [Afifella marina]RAI18753.1 CRISPR-associated helicase/endonuclease Cas3 [Afifella marina DSM 2698]SCZ45152.1 CRISPR-associated endonuclease/helicase Cas3 [Afifella marina DSM 2698]
MEFYAHSTKATDCCDWELLSDHLSDVARRAREFAAPLNLAEAAAFCGALHDLGKFSPAFQARLQGASEPVDHSTAGAKAVPDLFTEAPNQWIAWLMAQAIAGHHAGLPDRASHQPSSLEERLGGCTMKALAPGWADLLPDTPSELVPPFDWTAPDWPRCAFRFAMLGRMLFSCLVDADFKETELFYQKTGDVAKDRDWPSLAECLPTFLDAFEKRIAVFGEPQSEIGRLRAEILATARARAAMPPGLFTLNVPTGGGKTLASLGFALDHAKHHGHRRIIFGIPFTSIIDQTTAIFREILGNDLVLEHHSAIEDEETDHVGAADSTRSMKAKMRFAMEDWAAPVIVTTHVQLFESLFAARTSRCRKLHNIAGSVIVLDEAQTLPKKLLAPTVWAIDELCRNYDCSIVLCTATQPAFDARKLKALKPDHLLALDLDGRELAPDPPRLHKAFERGRLVFAGEMSDEDLVEALKEHPQALVIVNSRRHALDLYRAAQAEELDGLVHLTTRQYAMHRRNILTDVKRRLKDERPCRLIATSLIEAGVDVDFPVAWRAEAGLDQIAQAAGRVNREMRRPVEESVVTVFKPSDPDHAPPAEIKSLIGSMERMKDLFDNHFAPEAIERYFHEVYWQAGEARLGKPILDLSQFSQSYGPDIAYRTIAEHYRMIDDGMAAVIVARGQRAEQAVAKLGVSTIPSGAIARELQPYLVLVPPKARALLKTNEHIAFAHPDLRGDQFAILKTDALYEEDVGLLWENAEYLALENTIA